MFTLIQGKSEIIIYTPLNETQIPTNNASIKPPIAYTPQDKSRPYWLFKTLKLHLDLTFTR
ncbi:hypothetical protein GCM10007984_28740 [Shewanella putrefaciens]|nr:hypothetical protein GCM10007984_28740 [Shewanella putrefaciens]